MDALLNELRDEIYSDAVAHGLWDEHKNHYRAACKVRAEAEELVEESTIMLKFGTHCSYLQPKTAEILESVWFNAKDNFEAELADVIITALSAAGYLGIDIDKAVRAKMEINRGREWRHGK